MEISIPEIKKAVTAPLVERSGDRRVLQSITDQLLIVGREPFLPVNRDHGVNGPVGNPCESQRDGRRWFQLFEGHSPVFGPLAEGRLGFMAERDQVMRFKRAPQGREFNNIDFIAILNAHHGISLRECAHFSTDVFMSSSTSTIERNTVCV
jgi:hypothetical protein